MTKLGAKIKKAKLDQSSIWSLPLSSIQSTNDDNQDTLSSFENIETLHGWRFGSSKEYPEICCIECSCGYLSVRDRDEIKDHVCQSCGRKGTP